MSDTPASAPPFMPGEIIRPSPVLLRYYLIVSLCTGPGFLVAFPMMYFRYITLRYRFDADEDGGVWMSRGILFKKEVSLTYRRIQDIHVTRNIFERWLGLARVSVQTASGSSTPEMVVEGILGADALRDFLYHHMRGAKGQSGEAASPTGPIALEPAGADDEALALLREIRDSLTDMRTRLGAEGRS